MSKKTYYLAGPISHETTMEYIKWREDIGDFLLSIGCDYLNPLKKYKDSKSQSTKAEDVIMTKPNHIAREFIRRKIINPDLDLVARSNAIIAYVSKYGVGTSGEMCMSYHWNKPVYVVTPLKREQWSAWLLGLSTLIFPSWDALKEFLTRLHVEKLEG